MIVKLFKFCDHVFGDPKINPASLILDGARIIGNVTIEEGVIVAPGASIRADEEAPFFVGKGTNIQDGVVVHASKGKFVEDDNGNKWAVWIGPHSSITHNALIHGPVKIGKKVCVFFRATVHGAEIGDGCFIYIHAVVRGVKIPPRRYVAAGQIVQDQDVADNLPEVAEHHLDINREVVDINKKELLQRHNKRMKLKNSPLARILFCLRKKQNYSL